MSLSVRTLVAAVLLGTSAAAVATPAWDISNAAGSRNNSWSFGQNFTVGSSNIVVSRLGAFDASGNGFITVGGIPVGLFTSTGTLLASTNVTSSDALAGNYRYADITDVTLLAGQSYRVVAVNRDDLYSVANATQVSSLISSSTYGYCQSTALTFCSANTGSQIQWMANMQIGLSGDDVPEPAMLGLFGLGAIGLGLARRRRAA